MLDVNSPATNSHINEDDPQSTYHRGYLETVFSVIDAFKGYDNVIGFFSGNEIINERDQVAETPKYIRAVTRDMKRYLSKHSDRFIGVGYAATDTRSPEGAGADSVTDLWKYLACEDDNDVLSRADFFAGNIYSWCADADWRASGYLSTTSRRLRCPFSGPSTAATRPRVSSTRFPPCMAATR